MTSTLHTALRGVDTASDGVSMKAITTDRFGSPDVVSIRGIDWPQLPTGEVLVDVHAAGRS